MATRNLEWLRRWFTRDEESATPAGCICIHLKIQQCILRTMFSSTSATQDASTFSTAGVGRGAVRVRTSMHQSRPPRPYPPAALAAPVSPPV